MSMPNPAEFPQIGRLVNQAAGDGDGYAMDILKGNIMKSPVVLEHFSELVTGRYPEARILLPEKEAIDGAVEKALRLFEA